MSSTTVVKEGISIEGTSSEKLNEYKDLFQCINYIHVFYNVATVKCFIFLRLSTCRFDLGANLIVGNIIVFPTL